MKFKKQHLFVLGALAFSLVAADSFAQMHSRGGNDNRSLTKPQIGQPQPAFGRNMMRNNRGFVGQDALQRHGGRNIAPGLSGDSNRAPTRLGAAPASRASQPAPARTSPRRDVAKDKKKVAPVMRRIPVDRTPGRLDPVQPRIIDRDDMEQRRERLQELRRNHRSDMQTDLRRERHTPDNRLEGDGHRGSNFSEGGRGRPDAVRNNVQPQPSGLVGRTAARAAAQARANQNRAVNRATPQRSSGLVGRTVNRVQAQAHTNQRRAQQHVPSRNRGSGSAVSRSENSLHPMQQH